MPLNRRHFMSFLVAGLVGATSGGARAGWLNQAKGVGSMSVEFPPFELQASTSALRHLTSGLSGWRIERMGKSASNVWLRTSDGATWLIGVDQRDLLPMFEVFTLAMLSMSELQERWERWEPPALPGGVPEGFRQLLTTRPAAPVAPTDFEPWPLQSWRTEVVWRAEFIVEGGDVGPTFGNNPNTQSAARPGAVPPSASAFCEVAVGVLFSGEGRRLLLAVDWMPMNMLVVQDEAEISAFLADCELVTMADYVDGRRA
ncbi:hypothetical protein ACFQRC_14375 [Enterovirga sp. GCM10030262]|uniref:hypothetical protein n=1 Tax=Enterovirga sp. GCM10030262 TaxID=3273391 RepID=UPI003618C9E3